jgi:hypothetical protein
MKRDPVVSNCVGPNNAPIDRLYGSLHGHQYLIQKDFSTYKGKVTRKSLMKKDIDGTKFRSHCYVTDDNRWFDRSGMPMKEPKTVITDE